jgi:glucose-1-phosphate adenylyltransferase
VKDTLVMIMAGGKGSRLGPLTVHRSKPACPFAGRYRIIDFVLSNFVNSGLPTHLRPHAVHVVEPDQAPVRNWQLPSFGMYVEVVPAQMRLGERWYRGHRRRRLAEPQPCVRDGHCKNVAVFGGDHVYKHRSQPDGGTSTRPSKAALTIAAYPGASR